MLEIKRNTRKVSYSKQEQCWADDRVRVSQGKSQPTDELQ